MRDLNSDELSLVHGAGDCHKKHDDDDRKHFKKHDDDDRKHFKKHDDDDRKHHRHRHFHKKDDD